MLSIRRAFNPFRKQGSLVVSSRLFCAGGEELHTCSFGNHSSRSSGNGEESQSDRSLYLARFIDTSFGSQKLILGTRGFSSQVGTKSSGEEVADSEDGFSELEDSIPSDKIPGSTAVDDSDNELISGPELSEDDDIEVDGPQDVLDISDSEVDVVKKSGGKGESSGFLKSILAVPSLSVPKIVEKWVEKGNEVSRSDYALAMLGLRRRRMFGKALQLSEWLETNKDEFTDRDYASRVDLIAKVRGLHKAEYYIQKIPEGCRTETVYRTLLANCVSLCNLKKSEEVFNKMKDLEFPLTSFAYNQLLLLYKRCDKKKIADVLLLMEQENVKPSPFTYKILIDVKGQSNDVAGMDKVVETMKNDGIEPDLSTKALMARHYISAGLEEKAEDMLKEMEGADIKGNRWACQSLLPLYASLGKADDVGRLWSVCESNPRLTECISAIDAWGKLHKIDEAETVFDTMSKKFKKLSSKVYTVMLRVYANHKMLNKGKDLVKRMADSGCQIGPLTWDALVRLYIEAGEVDKAETVLHRATEQSRLKPMFSSYMAIMDQYAKKGDVHNTEKVFHRMRQAGYVSRMRPFQTLVQAYINGKAPAYGINERMKADNVFPNKPMAAQLARADPFRKTAVSELLD